MRTETPKGAGIGLAPETRTKLSAAITVALSRPFPRGIPVAPPCCDRCDQTLREPFTCKVCGYDGEPRVFSCTCSEDAARSAEMWASLRDRVAAGQVIEYDGTNWGGDKGTYTVEKAQALLDQAQARTRADYRCSGACAHLFRGCPVCQTFEDEDKDTNSIVGHLGSIIREVRRHLAQEGIL